MNISAALNQFNGWHHWVWMKQFLKYFWWVEQQTNEHSESLFFIWLFFCVLSTQTVAITPGTLFSRPVEHLVLRTFQTQLTQFDTLIESITIPFVFVLHKSLSYIANVKIHLCDIRTGSCLFLWFFLRLWGMQSMAINVSHSAETSVWLYKRYFTAHTDTLIRTF